MRSRVRLLAALVAILAAPATSSRNQPSPRSCYLGDPRLARLEAVFRAADCPASSLAEDFLAAADRNHLDWRLLPSICFIETSGGKKVARNNLLGWDSGRHRFPTARAGIHTVAGRLSGSKLYKGKDLDWVLRTYSKHPGYADRVRAVMRRLGPAEPR